jgi:hypothetical protein
MVCLPRYYLVLALGLVAVAWTVSSITTTVIGPSQDTNLRLYADLQNAAHTGKVVKIRAAAVKMADNASDPDLRSYAQFIARQNAQAERVGFESVQEQNTWSGYWRAFLAGWSDLNESFEGVMIFGDALLGNHGAVSDKYDQLLKERTTATQLGWWQFWLIVVAGMCLYLGFRKTLDPLLKALLCRVPWVNDFLTKPTKEQVSDPPLTPHP